MTTKASSFPVSYNPEMGVPDYEFLLPIMLFCCVIQ